MTLHRVMKNGEGVYMEACSLGTPAGDFVMQTSKRPCLLLLPLLERGNVYMIFTYFCKNFHNRSVKE